MHNVFITNYMYMQRAVALLQKRAKGDGWFLVRPNSRRPGYYALTLVYNSMPYHYEIVCEVKECLCARCIIHNILFLSLPPSLPPS